MLKSCWLAVVQQISSFCFSCLKYCTESFFVILNLKIMGNGHAWIISTLVPAKVFKSDFSLLGCAATPRKCSHQVGAEITSMIGGN